MIFMELCENLRGALEGLRDCRLPVALQAFAQTADAFPKAWSPLSVVAPLTEFSAEFQAMAYAMENPTTELVFVDRAVDYVFQWMPQKEDELERHLVKEEEHGIRGLPKPQGKRNPATFLITVQPSVCRWATWNRPLTYSWDSCSRMHGCVVFTEWWGSFVEQAVLASDYATYRYVMALVGSLLRRLGRKDEITKMTSGASATCDE